MIQFLYFKYTKENMELACIFRMSPLHHHFQKGGMHEVKIVNRFWIVAAVFAVISIITLK